MRIYTVIPIAKGFGKEVLTYFGGDDIAPGALVTIPLRKRTVHALVIEAAEIGKSKEELKSSRFALKKIGKVVQKDFLSHAVLETAEISAQFYTTTVGAILEVVLPKLILENPANSKTRAKHAGSKLKKEVLAIEDSDLDRFAHYKAFIRGEFARASSVYFCLPTLEDIRKVKKLLDKGIEQYTVVLHSGLTKKEFQKALAIIEKEKHPILIIGTAPFLSVSRSDLGSIILERENSRAYRTLRRPFIDLRLYVRYLSHALNVKLILGDLLLSVETLWHVKQDEYAEFMPLKWRLLSSGESLLVDMKLPKGQTAEKVGPARMTAGAQSGGFKILSRELEALIDKTIEDSEHLFIFCARKGLAPLTVCGDCGMVVTCHRCGAPVTLVRRGAENVFICNKCGEERGTAERCKNCDSWKLDTLGIGAEGVEEEIKNRFPKAKVFRIDKDNAATSKKVSASIEKWQTTPGSILIGTELALLYLNENVQNIAVASLDALLTLPDFRINEKILYLLLTMRERADKVFLIQTRNANAKIFDYALKGNLSDFYRDEITDRERFKYPPFSQFVKFTLEGKGVRVTEESAHLVEYFKDWKPTSFEGTYLSKRGNTLIHILFRFNPKGWPDEKFLEKVRTLPPQVAIYIDPESLF